MTLAFEKDYVTTFYKTARRGGLIDFLEGGGRESFTGVKEPKLLPPRQEVCSAAPPSLEDTLSGESGELPPL